jgi:hypothetical protein
MPRLRARSSYADGRDATQGRQPEDALKKSLNAVSATKKKPAKAAIAVAQPPPRSANTRKDAGDGSTPEAYIKMTGNNRPSFEEALCQTRC